MRAPKGELVWMLRLPLCFRLQECVGWTHVFALGVLIHAALRRRETIALAVMMMPRLEQLSADVLSNPVDI